MRFKLAQLSDTHIPAVPRADGRRPDLTLAAALARVAEEQADAILITGDLVHHGDPSEYAALRAILAEASAPVFLLPGNHDDPEVLRQAFPEHLYLPRHGRLRYCVEDWPLRLVALDDWRGAGISAGVFSEEEAGWLDARLGEAPHRPTLVALHHPPFPTHDPVFDQSGLEGREQLEAVIARHPQVERVLCGHYHRATLARFGGTVAAVAPSTAWAFQLHLDGEEAVKLEQPLGFALHVWEQRLGLATHFVWL